MDSNLYWKLYRFYIVLADMGNIQAKINWKALNYALKNLNIRGEKPSWWN